MTDDEHQRIVRQLLEEDRRQIAEQRGISHTRVQKIISEKLGMVKVAACWIPHRPSEEEKLRRLNTARLLVRDNLC